MKFYLGVHEPAWLPRSPVPLFVSHRRLARRVKLPVANHHWALDSGGFTELSQHGAWRTTPTEYADAVATYAGSVGLLEWAAPQDWMCEPFMLDLTGRSIGWHQGATIESVMTLRDLVPDVHFIPVLQGWAIDDYLDHIEQYADAGIDLTTEPTVGVGSVCRRQSTDEIAEIFGELSDTGILCHGFGVKTGGLKRYAPYLTSADSMAWSYNARLNPPLPECTHKQCQNCWTFALRWRNRLVERLALAA